MRIEHLLVLKQKIIDLTTAFKISKFFEKQNGRLKNWRQTQVSGNLYDFETELAGQLGALHDRVLGEVLPAAESR